MQEYHVLLTVAHRTQLLCALCSVLGQGEAVILPCQSLTWESKGGMISPGHRKSHRDFRPVFFILLVLHFVLYHSGQSQSHAGRRVKAVLSFSLSQQLVRESLIAIFILALVESNPFHSKLLPWHLNLSGRLPVAAPYFSVGKEKKNLWHVINGTR